MAGLGLSAKRKPGNPSGSKEETPCQKSVAVTVTRRDLLLPSQPLSGFGNEELGDAGGGHFRGGRVLGDLPPTVLLRISHPGAPFRWRQTSH